MKSTVEELDAVAGMAVIIMTNKGEKLPGEIIRVSPSKMFVVVKIEEGKRITFTRRLTDMRYRSNRKIIGWLKEAK